MRPIRLEVEGFTCYRDRQEPLEFSGFSLFAIAGPTGAGKSSILDAILYALYGEIPRIGKQGIGEVMSQGRDVLSVCLDFLVQGVTYRVTRRSKRVRKGGVNTTATLAEISGGLERSIADQVRPVNDAVVRILGLDYSAFTQTVVLPQGEFARFLKSDPKGQRDILQHLLKHDVFQRMRDEAEKRRNRLNGELVRVEQQVSDLDGQTEEALHAKDAELLSARLDLERLASERSKLDVQVQEARRLRRLTEDLSRARTDAVRLEAEEAGIASARSELALAQKASRLMPRLEAANVANQKSTRSNNARTEAADTVSRLADRIASVEQDLQAAAEAARQCADLNDRIRRIDEIKGDLERRRSLSLRVDALASNLPIAARSLADASDALKRAVQRAEDAHGNVEAQEAAMAAIAYEEGLHLALDEVWPRVLQIRTIDEDLRRLEHDLGSSEEAFRAAERDAEDARRQQNLATTALNADRRLASEAESGLAKGQARHQAAALRAHLHPGDNCPVCLQVVATLPDVEAPPELVELIERHKGASARVLEASERALAADRLVASTGARLEGAATLRGLNATRLQERAMARSTEANDILQSLAVAAPHIDRPDPFSWIDETRLSLSKAKQARGRIDELRHRAQQAEQKAGADLLNARGDALRAEERHARALDEHRECVAELETVSRRIASVSTYADPSIERAELAQRVIALQKRERDVEAALAKLQQEVAGAAAAFEAASTAAGDAETEAVAAERILEEELRATGFATRENAVSAARTDAHLKGLDETIRKHDDALLVVRQKLRELEPEVAGREVSAEALQEAEKSFADSSIATSQADRHVSILEREQAALVTAVARRSQFVTERDQIRGRHAITAEMASDLKGDKFQEYLLEEAFRGLVAGASVRMRDISNRYTLEWDAGQFYVVDHDNAGERRRAETLSGGETFMASLCLALQLSDEVLRTSGALQMDSLFIDEGFGTLDADSLTEVTNAMETLRQEGNRLVGVISHRPELTDRLPGCVRIEKGAGESRWRVERVG